LEQKRVKITVESSPSSSYVFYSRAKEIGSCATSFGELKDRAAAGEAIDFLLINETKKNDPKKGDSYENSGVVSLLSMKKKKLRTKRVKKAVPTEEGKTTFHISI